MSYWTDRQEQLKRSAEKSEEALKKRLGKFYDSEFRRLDKEIAAYYQNYGYDKVIEYRRLLQSLSDEDRTLLQSIHNMLICFRFESQYIDWTDCKGCNIQFL